MSIRSTFLSAWSVALSLLLVILLTQAPADGDSSHAGARSAGLASPFPLEPVFRLKPVDGSQRLITRSAFDFKKLQSAVESVAFQAVCADEWPAGLVPVFAIAGKNGFELRRLPPLGQENFSNPLFFALPPKHEPAAERIAGRWECVAARAGDLKDYFALELAVESEKVSGRFDQNTEYRYPYITAGSFRSNRVELRVEYIQDVYLLEGDSKNGSLSGRWRRADDSEGGTWEATREPMRLPHPQESVPLYEWRRAVDGTRRYALEPEQMEPGWERLPNPLCRVWRAEQVK